MSILTIFDKCGDNDAFVATFVANFQMLDTPVQDVPQTQKVWKRMAKVFELLLYVGPYYTLRF